MHLYQEITNKKRYCIKKNIKLNTMKLNLNFDLIVICKLYIFLEEKITMMELENKSLVDITKNLRDIFPEPPNPEDVPNCSLNGVLGTLPGIIGTLMAQETLKLILELPTLKNELLLFDTLNLNFTKLKF